MNKATLKKIGNIIGRIITVLSLAFIVVAVYKLGFDFSSVDNVPSFIGIVIVSGIILCVSVLVMGTAWKLWLSFFSEDKIPYGETVSVYAKANIGKYLPGNVMHYVERNLFAGKLGVSQKKIALCSVIEIIGQAGIAVVFGVIFSYKQLRTALGQLITPSKTPILMLAVAFVIVVVFAGLYIFRNRIKSFCKQYLTKGFVITGLKSIALYGIVLLVGGCIMVLLYVYLGGEVNLEIAMHIISSYIIAWVLGFVVPGAPGGIGVREFVLTLLLASTLGQEITLTVSVIHRLTNIAGDFLAYILRLVIFKEKSKGSKDLEETL